MYVALKVCTKVRFNQGEMFMPIVFQNQLFMLTWKVKGGSTLNEKTCCSAVGANIPLEPTDHPNINRFLFNSFAVEFHKVDSFHVENLERSSIRSIGNLVKCNVYCYYTSLRFWRHLNVSL